MTNKQYKILKYISTHDNTQSVCEKFSVNYQELQNMLPKNSLIFNRDCSKVYLTDWVVSDIEARHRDSFRFAIPIVISNLISLAALIVAILAYIKQ